MSPAEPIVVIGTGCRFPGLSSTPAKLWDLLNQPRDVASKVPRDRFDGDAFYHPDGSHHGTTNARESYFLTENVSGFDTSFFNISAKEAECIDPQQRLLMETVYEGVEAAGLRMEDLKGSPTGVFCGVMCDDYQTIQMRDVSAVPRYTATGTARSIISNRVSYFFDWHGPSMTIDTACSSSLVAVDLAAKALHDGDCRVAIASGTNLILAPNMYITESKLKMLSPRGRSRMWDAGADGYARGEGVAAVVLKKLSDAIADNDSIECIIRATHVNQDGRSMGITMPSSAAQTSLIQSTYRKAGLDPITRPEDRCQYFEAHGTGTPAGDPQEASAIDASFFPDKSNQSSDLLYVGSAKTVIGHTEGTAGLAALIKGALSLQHGVIAPNLHFERLNPEIERYYTHLCIPTEPKSWPELPAGTPRRVSVNSFGFGGTNAHAILESIGVSPTYSLSSSHSKPADWDGVIPFVFSAHSEKALGNLLAAYVQYLKKNPGIDIADLAWSLFRRRTTFSHKLAVYAPSSESLQGKLQDEITRRQSNQSSAITSKPTVKAPRLLGVFTGQGAQWPQMGLDLLRASSDATAWLDSLQASLDQLPAEYQPHYSLRGELSASPTESRLHLAEISQPLCTAVQIMLVKFLRSLKIEFSAVVGHSSGEIAAAYAAGFLSETEAIRIAHLRGHLTSLAGSNGQQGAMTAVGMSVNDAQEICQSSTYLGRVTIAAVNSSSSVTLSGDAQAVRELEGQLKDQEIFARLLKVNMAYHSHHMFPCSEPYIRALEDCHIQPRSPTGAKWFSSVYGGQQMGPVESWALQGSYWSDNMVSTVLFTQAVTAAARNSSYDMIVEVGPHPALKAPVLNVLSEIFPNGTAMPAYTSLLRRFTSGVESSAAAIGDFYSYIGSDHVDIETYARHFHKKDSFKLVKGLPCYPFDRSNLYWAESRSSKSFSREAGRPHQLLGSLCPETVEGEYRWRNFLRQPEIEWLSGHCIQSQVVFPATGYVAMALEAICLLAGDRQVQLFDIQDLSIKSAIAISEDDLGTETLFKVDELTENGNQLSASFSCSSTVGGNFQQCSSGRCTVTFGDQSASLLPSKQIQSQKMLEIDIDSFYHHLGELGYGYTGLFRGISSLMWKKGSSSGLLHNACQLDPTSPLALHPALMDLLLQAMLAAVGKPGDQQLYTLHIPVSLGRIAINPAFCGAPASRLGSELPFEATLTSVGREGATGDAALFDTSGNGIVQIEGIEVTPLMRPTSADDRQLFFGVHWGPLLPDLSSSPSYLTIGEADRCHWAERLALAYISDVHANLTADDRAKLDWHGSKVVAWIDHVLSLTREGKHPVCQPGWLLSSLQDVYQAAARVGNPVEISVLRTVGENLLHALRHETTILEELRQTGLLDAIYKETVELAHFNKRVGDLMEQLSMRFPRMKVLEIGAGSGSATKEALNKLGRSYHSYTFTDISAGFFEEAQSTFQEHAGRIVYQVLDIGRDPQEQGFQPQSFDLVIAANVLHATRNLRETLTNARKLLKPGGYLALLEGANPNLLRLSFTLAGFEGWWLGENDGRPLGPMVTPFQWDHLLQETGFSGIDTITNGHDDGLTAFSAFASQAVDDHINLLRDPLGSASITHQRNDLVIVGGASLTTAKLVASLGALLRPFFRQVIRIRTLQDPVDTSLSMITLLNIADLDRPFFQDLTPQSLTSMQTLMGAVQNLLWVTIGSDADKPYQSMSQGLLRCSMYESPHARFQHLNIGDGRAVDARVIAESLLRVVLPEFDNDYRLPRATWTTEPELRLVDSVMRIPRITADPGMNERYMSQRRMIYNEADLHDSNVVVTIQNGIYEPLLSALPTASDDPSVVRIRVASSTLTAIRVKGVGFLHLVIGHNLDTQEKVVALAKDNAAVISTPFCWAIPRSVTDPDEPHLASQVAWSLLAVEILESTTAYTSLVVHDAPKSLRDAIKLDAPRRNIGAFFTTSDQELAQEEDGVVFLHPLTPMRRLADNLPADISLVVTLDAAGEATFNRLPAIVHGRAAQQNFHTFHRAVAALLPNFEIDQVADALKYVVGLSASSNEERIVGDIVPVQSLPGSPMDITRMKILDWQQSSHVSVSVQPASSEVRLSADKTYLLIGMTGDLGMSVCEWMVSKGARNVVLTSRKPQTDQNWIESMAKAGANIVTMAMDVTNRESILQADERINNELPPLGGIVNGAMVLVDQLFTQMAFEVMDKVLKPKVQGSLLLDEVYAHTDLEFFICFGSLTGPAGNRGQSAYSAATAFMTSLIEGRRKRGVVGSIINPGEIRGVGYVARTSQGLVEIMRDSIGDTQVSEAELNELFAEAIIAGRPGSGREAAPIAGFPFVTPEEQPNIIWLPNPRAWRQINYSGGTSSGATGNEATPVKEQLASVTTVHEAGTIIEEALIAKIRKKLQLPTDGEVTKDHSLMELGVDSLVAVDLRTWFVKELGVDMPIIRLLNSSSIGELIENSMSRLPECFLVNLSGEPEESREVVEERDAGIHQQPPMDRKGSDFSIDTQATSTDSDVFSPPDDESSATVTDSDSSPSPREDKPSSAAQFERVEELSYAQSRFWFLQQFRQDKTSNNITLLSKLDAMPNVDDLRTAVYQLGMRHEILRTCYRSGDNGPYQAVLPASTMHLEVVRVDGEADARDIYLKLRGHMYDLVNGENMRLCLAITSEDKPFIIMGFHHICLDGASFHMLLNELELAYLKQPLAPPSKQYAEYAMAQRATYESGQMAKEMAYWRKEFETIPDPIPLLPMSKAQSRPALSDHPTEDIRLEVPASLMDKIKAIGKRLRVTPFNFFLSTLRVFLGRLTQSSDFCIGVSDVHRVEEGDHTLIGLLLNLLPIRFIGGLDSHTFRDILTHTQAKARAAIANSRAQFDRILDELSVPRSGAHSPLFQVMIDWQPQNTEKRSFGNLKSEVQEWTINKTTFDMVLSIMDSGDGTAILNFRLQQALFSRHGAELVARSYVALVESFASDFGQPVTEPPLYPPSDTQGSIELGRGPPMVSPWPSTVSRRVDDIAMAFSDHVAVKESGSRRALTYKELANRVNLIASQLRANGVGQGSVVCLFQHPTADWISCMLAIWRLGATYVPLDVRNPQSRLATMLEDCQPQVILCHDETEEALNSISCSSVKPLNISHLDPEIQGREIANHSASEACSVILYSSGTTGRPKGFQLSHANLRNQLEAFTSHCKLDSPTVLQQGAMTFDISLEQMLVPLTTGGRVLLAPRTVRGDPISLTNAIVDEKVTCTMATPSEYMTWIQYGCETLKRAANWQIAFSGGEAFPNSLSHAVRRLDLPSLRLFNFYGPGETTIASHQKEIDYQIGLASDNPTVSVGKALPNYTTYIVDGDMNPVPQGISGEIVIGGAGPCMGYLHLDELNEAKFVRDKFAPASHTAQGWTRAYRTAERGHLLPDGELVLEGRLEGDTQIKLRGMRMELGDIESEIIRAAEGSLSLVVVSLRDVNGPFLAAHAEFQPNYSGDKEQFLREIRASLNLPQYMKPSIIVPIEQMPTTAHGKLDRQEIGRLTLPERKRSSLTVEPSLGLTEWDQVIGEIWGEALEGTFTDLSNLDRDTDFFLAGGNSVLLVKLQAILAEKVGAKVALIDLVEGSTLGEMADNALAHRARPVDSQAGQIAVS